MKRKAPNNGQTAQITLATQVWKEGGTYVAYAPELDVSSCGSTLAGAKRALREAVDLFLEDAAERGVLADVLAESGFVQQGNKFQFRRVLGREKVRLPMPQAS
ncbi:MAG: type II toxin-antitoxin system HicB family antitoxin [Terriglobales bacterium]